MFATIDGVSVPDPYAHRETTPPGQTFEFDVVANNPFRLPAGHSDIAITDGYWLMLPPLSPGQHTIHYGGKIDTRYTNDVTATITVVPEPAAVGLAAAAGALALHRRSRKEK